MQHKEPSPVPMRWLSEAQRNQLVTHIRSTCTNVLHDWSAAHNDILPLVRYVEDRRSLLGCNYLVEHESTVLAIWALEVDSLKQLLRLPPGTQVSFNDGDGFAANLELDLVTALSRQLVPDELKSKINVKRILHSDVSGLIGKGVRHVFDIGCDSQSACCQLELSPTLINLQFPRATSQKNINVVSRRIAIGNEAVPLDANLGHIELSFNELRDLRVGDVLILEQALTKPITIHTKTGKLVGEAMLGRYKTHLALQIEGLPTPNNSAKRSIR